jgi:hypothetical protein
MRSYEGAVPSNIRSSFFFYSSSVKQATEFHGVRPEQSTTFLKRILSTQSQFDCCFSYWLAAVDVFDFPTCTSNDALFDCEQADVSWLAPRHG